MMLVVVVVLVSSPSQIAHAHKSVRRRREFYACAVTNDEVMILVSLHRARAPPPRQLCGLHTHFGVNTVNASPWKAHASVV